MERERFIELMQGLGAEIKDNDLPDFIAIQNLDMDSEEFDFEWEPGSIEPLFYQWMQKNVRAALLWMLAKSCCYMDETGVHVSFENVATLRFPWTEMVRVSGLNGLDDWLKAITTAVQQERDKDSIT